MNPSVSHNQEITIKNFERVPVPGEHAHLDEVGKYVGSIAEKGDVMVTNDGVVRTYETPATINPAFGHAGETIARTHLLTDASGDHTRAAEIDLGWHSKETGEEYMTNAAYAEKVPVKNVFGKTTGYREEQKTYNAIQSPVFDSDLPTQVNSIYDAERLVAEAYKNDQGRTVN